MNKGLGAPVGALLAGPADVIERARVNLQRIGAGSVHSMGSFAAAALVALQGIGRVADDNRRAARLAELIGAPRPETNIVIHTVPVPADGWREALARRGVLAYPHSVATVRFVTHRGIGRTQIERAADAIRACL